VTGCLTVSPAAVSPIAHKNTNRLVLVLTLILSTCIFKGLKWLNLLVERWKCRKSIPSHR